MKNVLIVDDEKNFLLSLVEGLNAYAGDFNVLIAENGKAATGILSTTKIDLVVTDLKMPVMDGFELLAYITRYFPLMPVLVMTAFGSPEIEQQLQKFGVHQFLEKPLDFDLLVKRIFESLNAGDKGHLQGISLPTFLQMVEMERKTYTLNIKADKKVGDLYFLKGKLVNAEFGDLKGEEAAYEIIAWDNPEIEIDHICHQKEKRIDPTLTHILMESLRRKDEKNKEQSERRVKGDVNKSQKSPAEKLELNPAEIQQSSVTSKEVKVMAVQDKLKEFSSIEGFAGVGLFTPTGESLALLAADGKVNIKDIGILANNVLRNAQKASLDMGAGRGQLVHVEAEKAHIIVRCLNEGNDPLKSEPGKAHIHLVLVLSSDASIGLAKLKVNSIIGTLAPDFRL
jgi:response regulator RpfG family c-di-GMP phosphodiesterase